MEQTSTRVRISHRLWTEMEPTIEDALASDGEDSGLEAFRPVAEILTAPAAKRVKGADLYDIPAEHLPALRSEVQWRLDMAEDNMYDDRDLWLPVLNSARAVLRAITPPEPSRCTIDKCGSTEVVRTRHYPKRGPFPAMVIHECAEHL